MRHAVFSHLNINPLASRTCRPGSPGLAGWCRSGCRWASWRSWGWACWALRSWSSARPSKAGRASPSGTPARRAKPTSLYVAKSTPGPGPGSRRGGCPDGARSAFPGGPGVVLRGEYGGPQAQPAEGPPDIERRRVATGANHPASHSSAFRRGPGTPAGAPTGDQSTAMHVTPKPPLVRQDRITSRSGHRRMPWGTVQPFPGCFSAPVSWLNGRGGGDPAGGPSGPGLPAGHPAASGGV